MKVFAQCRNFVRAAADVWLDCSGWFKAALLWTTFWWSVHWMVMDVHARPPRPYNAPEKVAVRKMLLVVRGLGVLALMATGMASAEKRNRKKASGPERD